MSYPMRIYQEDYWLERDALLPAIDINEVIVKKPSQLQHW